MPPKSPAERQVAVALSDVLPDTLWPQIKRRTGIWRELAIRKRETEVDLRVTDLFQRSEAKNQVIATSYRLVVHSAGHLPTISSRTAKDVANGPLTISPHREV